MWAIFPRRCWISGRSNPLPGMGHSSFSPHDKELKLPSEGWLLFSYCPTPRGFFFQKPFAAKFHLSSRLQLLAWSRSLVQKEEPSPGVSQIDTTSDSGTNTTAPATSANCATLGPASSTPGPSKARLSSYILLRFSRAARARACRGGEYK